MSVAFYSPLPPELGPREIDARSIHAFRHSFPSPLIRWHCHDEYELHLIATSAGQMFVGDHVGSFSAGQLVMTGPCLPHNWISQTQPGTVVDDRDCVVQFRKHLVPSMAAGAAELESLLPLLDRARYGIEFRGEVCLAARTWFDEMINAEGSSRIGLLIGFLDALNRETDYSTLSTMPSGARQGGTPYDRLERVVNYINEHYANPIPLNSVARLAGMSTSSFSHFFAKSTGSNFTEFLNRVRVAHACELLSTTDKPVTEICHAVGFNNVANFNRRFRELRSQTPREYRKQTHLGHQP